MVGMLLKIHLSRTGTKNQQNVEKREQGQDCNKDLLNVGCK